MKHAQLRSSNALGHEQQCSCAQKGMRAECLLVAVYAGHVNMHNVMLKDGETGMGMRWWTHSRLVGVRSGHLLVLGTSTGGWCDHSRKMSSALSWRGCWKQGLLLITAKRAFCGSAVWYVSYVKVAGCMEGRVGPLGMLGSTCECQSASAALPQLVKQDEAPCSCGGRHAWVPLVQQVSSLVIIMLRPAIASDIIPSLDDGVDLAGVGCIPWSTYHGADIMS
jgi:hypothetical protein